MMILRKLADFISVKLYRLSIRFVRLGVWGKRETRQGDLGGVGQLDFAALVLACAGQNPDFSFVQIGANDGKSGDPLHDCIKTFDLRGILVEPQSGPFAALKANYAGQSRLSFEQAVIAETDGTARFYRVDPGFWQKHNLPQGNESDISSLKAEHIRFHIALFGGEKLAAHEGEYLRWDDVPALTLNTLLAKYQLPEPDLLLIDTEGYDYAILQMVDWHSPPAIVYYESVHLSDADLIASFELLLSKGYRLFAADGFNTVAVLERQAPRQFPPTTKPAKLAADIEALL